MLVLVWFSCLFVCLGQGGGCWVGFGFLVLCLCGFDFVFFISVRL